jgi:hypothetical protein
MFEHLFDFSQNRETPDWLHAIDRAVLAVEPHLKELHGYPDAYRKPVATALEYARRLALSVPGPIAVNPDSFARDAYVHAIFPSVDIISEAFRSSRTMQDYLREDPKPVEVYALMGMRRLEKSMLGMELSGQVLQRDVPQCVVYFTGHTLETPAPSESGARAQIAWRFFDSLVGQVVKRLASRKQGLQSQLLEKDALMTRLHEADAESRPAIQAALSDMLDSIQVASTSLDLHNYLDDFDAVLSHPEHYLRMNQSTMTLDGMGVRRDNEAGEPGQVIVFNDLIGFDRRDWTVTMVHCSNIPSETFAARLETAYRRLSI